MRVNIVRSALARRLTLRVSQLTGAVRLTMPKYAPMAEAERFLADKAHWVRRHVGSAPVRTPVGFGSVIPIRGTACTIVEGQQRRVVRSGDRLLVPAGEAMVAARVQAFLKQTARAAFHTATDHYAAALGRPYGTIALRDTRSRWGSCSAQGNLNYSWRLVMALPAVLDYVAAHEVAHLEEMNHSPAFWATVARLYPDYKPQKAWLKRHGAQLHGYRFEGGGKW